MFQIEKSPVESVKAAFMYFHRFQHLMFLIHSNPPIVSELFSTASSNLLATQLSIFISNLSFSSNNFSLSCFLSLQRVSPLVEFWSYPLRFLLFFWLLSDVSGCLSAFICASLFPNLLLRMACRFLPVLFLFVWRNPWYSACASGFHFPMSASAVPLSCSSSSDLYHTLMVIAQKVISISSFLTWSSFLAV